ncbi:MAG TPA: hypothetical protein VEW93_02490 [Acidimicrobiales bacterium]|nr:hypothetical protein [Acidimicrobiales bacterium]
MDQRGQLLEGPVLGGDDAMVVVVVVAREDPGERCEDVRVRDGPLVAQDDEVGDPAGVVADV